MIPAIRIISSLLPLSIFILSGHLSHSQIKWQNIDSLFQPLPASVHVYKTTDLLDGKPNIAYYVEADLKDKRLHFTVDTTLRRRLTPAQFYEKNDRPLLVVNTTFFSFATNQNVTTVIKDGKIVGFNAPVRGTGKDSANQYYYFKSAIGIFRNRRADVAWLGTDSTFEYGTAYQFPVKRNEWGKRQPGVNFSYEDSIYKFTKRKSRALINHKWKANTAVGGGPVLIQDGKIMITNDEERMFAGKAINDRHPRTAMGYTKGNKLIILVIEGRNTGIAEGATLIQEAQMLKDIGCLEALNLDGGGSSCMLVNGKETIKPSDKEGQRPVPAVFIVKSL
ncbi:MAG: phosphodiester glycosidase family protein [Chitinophagaceae bacterium]|nr:phosphodiester glycosidase family protein [Chitinophagaceae bacterium]